MNVRTCVWCVCLCISGVYMCVVRVSVHQWCVHVCGACVCTSVVCTCVWCMCLCISGVYMCVVRVSVHQWCVHVCGACVCASVVCTCVWCVCLCISGVYMCKKVRIREKITNHLSRHSTRSWYSICSIPPIHAWITHRTLYPRYTQYRHIQTSFPYSQAHKNGYILQDRTLCRVALTVFPGSPLDPGMPGSPSGPSGPIGPGGPYKRNILHMYCVSK